MLCPHETPSFQRSPLAELAAIGDTFGHFVDSLDLSAPALLKSRTWSEWKAIASGTSAPDDPDLKATRDALARISLRTDPDLLASLRSLSTSRVAEEPAEYCIDDRSATALHYLLWGKKAEQVSVANHQESLQKWLENSHAVRDAQEIAAWRMHQKNFATPPIQLPFPCPLRLHAAYGSPEIKAALGLADLHRPGPAGTGVLHAQELRTYIHLVTFRKDQRDFSPTTLYRDYPISRTLLHWESQANTTQQSPTGQNYLHFKEQGYTILFFARLEKRIDGVTAPFLFLGPAKRLVSYKGNRPVAMEWELQYPIPAELFEMARV